MNRETANWLASVQYDLDTAEYMQKTRRYLYVIFMCHLSIEKTLKALVCEATNASPPRIHDLSKLAALANVTLEPSQAQFIAQLTDANITTRYPDDLAQMVSQYPRAVARTYLERTREVITCLRADPRLNPSSPTT